MRKIIIALLIVFVLVLAVDRFFIAGYREYEIEKRRALLESPGFSRDFARWAEEDAKPVTTRPASQPSDD